MRACTHAEVSFSQIDETQRRNKRQSAASRGPISTFLCSNVRVLFNSGLGVRLLLDHPQTRGLDVGEPGGKGSTGRIVLICALVRTYVWFDTSTSPFVCEGDGFGGSRERPGLKCWAEGQARPATQGPTTTLCRCLSVHLALLFTPGHLSGHY